MCGAGVSGPGPCLEEPTEQTSYFTVAEKEEPMEEMCTGGLN